jgi:flagellar biosynthesis protein FliR
MSNILISDFVIVLLIFIRILAAFVAAPIFGHVSIPAIVKIFLSFVIAYIIFLVMPVKPEIQLRKLSRAW